jgi:hypothetical protein
MKLRTLLVVAFVLLAVSASAQAPFPGAVQVSGGWVPCDHPVAIAAGIGCVPAPGTTASAPTSPANTVITGIYPQRSDMGTRFELGKTYESPYGFRVTIIGTVRKTDGSFVFVAEVVKSSGSPMVGEILQFPVDEDRGAFQFEVPSDPIVVQQTVIR